MIQVEKCGSCAGGGEVPGGFLPTVPSKRMRVCRRCAGTGFVRRDKDVLRSRFLETLFPYPHAWFVFAQRSDIVSDEDTAVFFVVMDIYADYASSTWYLMK